MSIGKWGKLVNRSYRTGVKSGGNREDDLNYGSTKALDM